MNSSDPEDLDFDPIDDYGNFDMAMYGMDPIIFPSFQKPIRKTLWVILFYLIDAQMTLKIIVTMKLYLISLFLNTVHLIILTRKSMRNNAVNIILAAIAINDIFMALMIFFADLVEVETFDISRVKTEFIDVEAARFIILSIGNILKRNSVWLPITLATTRALVLRNFDNSKFSFMTTAKFGMISIFVELSINLAIGLIAFLIVTRGGVADSDGHYQMPVDRIGVYDKAATVIHSILPSLLYPILTFVLLRALKKSRSQISSVKNDRGKGSVNTMVLMLTIFFMVSELPQGIGGILKVLSGHNQGIYYMGGAIFNIFLSFSALNASTHLFICLKMSSNYRDAFFSLIRMNRKNKVSNQNRETTIKRGASENRT